MKRSKMGLKSTKSRGTEEFASVEILLQSGQLKRTAAGIYSLGPVLVRSLNKLTEISRKIFDKYDFTEVSLPILQSKTLWEESGRWEKYKNNGTTFYSCGRDGEYLLSPTGEELVCDLVRRSISSAKDLNFTLYQFGKKFRDEVRVRGGLVRCKEFTMHDGYGFHTTKEEMMKGYEAEKAAYLEIFKALNLDAVPVRAINDYGYGVAEEIMCFCDMGEDKVLYDGKTGLTINAEVLEDAEIVKELEQQYGKINLSAMQEKKAVELAHCFHLGTFYSERMQLFYTDTAGNKQPVYMSTFGYGLGRALNIALALSADNDGLVFPKAVAPFAVGIVSLCEDVHKQKAKDLYNQLQERGIDVLWDDREISMGAKIKDMLLVGIPYFIILGNRQEGDLYEVEDRKSRQKQNLTLEQIINLFI